MRKSTGLSGAPDNSSLSHFSTMTRPCWLRRAVRNRHRHAVELASRRWRGGHDSAVAETRREKLIYALLGLQHGAAWLLFVCNEWMHEQMARGSDVAMEQLLGRACLLARLLSSRGDLLARCLPQSPKPSQPRPDVSGRRPLPHPYHASHQYKQRPRSTGARQRARLDG